MMFMSYSAGMNDTDAPILSTNRDGNTYPSPTSKVGKAWQDVWAQLADGEPADGRLIANQVAGRNGIAPVTVHGLLHRMAKAGHLVKSHGLLAGKRGVRPITFYRRVIG